jgi:hypothetical protein
MHVKSRFSGLLKESDPKLWKLVSADPKLLKFIQLVRLLQFLQFRVRLSLN